MDHGILVVAPACHRAELARGAEQLLQRNGPAIRACREDDGGQRRQQERGQDFDQLGQANGRQAGVSAAPACRNCRSNRHAASSQDRLARVSGTSPWARASSTQAKRLPARSRRTKNSRSSPPERAKAGSNQGAVHVLQHRAADQEIAGALQHGDRTGRPADIAMAVGGVRLAEQDGALQHIGAGLRGRRRETASSQSGLAAIRRRRSWR